MLTTPPPGANATAINQQSNQFLSSPGPQGAKAQGYEVNPYVSSYATPSSYAVPSTVNTPRPWYSQNQSDPYNAMLQALRGGQ